MNSQKTHGKVQVLYSGIVLFMGMAIFSFLFWRKHFILMVDGPDHFVMVKLFYETLLGMCPQFEILFKPHYKLFSILALPFYALSSKSTHPETWTYFPAIISTALVAGVFLSLFFGHRLLLKRPMQSFYEAIITGILLLFSTLSFISLFFYWGFVSTLVSASIQILTVFLLESYDFQSTHSNRKRLVLFALVFLCYAAHPISLFFLGIWLITRVTVHLLVDKKTFSIHKWIFFGSFVAFWIVYHQVTTQPAAQGSLRQMIFNAGRIIDLRGFVENFRSHFLDTVSWSPAYLGPFSERISPVFPLSMLFFIAVSLGACIWKLGTKHRISQFSLAAVFFLFFGWSLNRDIIPVTPPVMLAFAGRFGAAALPLVLGASTLAIRFLLFDDLHSMLGKKPRLVMGSVLTGILACSLFIQVRALESIFRDYDLAVTQIWPRLSTKYQDVLPMSTEPIEFKGVQPTYLHLHKYRLLWNQKCQSSSDMFFESIPKLELDPIKKRTN